MYKGRKFEFIFRFVSKVFEDFFRGKGELKKKNKKKDTLANTEVLARRSVDV